MENNYENVLPLPKKYKQLSETDEKTLSKIALQLSVLALGLTVFLAVTVGLIASGTLEPRRLATQVGVHVSTENSSADSAAFACVRCVQLLRDPNHDITDDPLLRKLTIKVKDGEEECCAYNSEQITALFESVVRLNDHPFHQLPGSNLSDFMFSPVSAHKRIYPTRIVRTFGIPEIPKHPPACEFKPDDPRLRTEHHRGVDVLKRGLRIRHGGLYYIYVSLLFRPQSLRPCREFKFQTFHGYVERRSRYRPSDSGLLMTASHTCCDTCINTQELKFVGGVFILHPGDLIRVKVTSFELVHFHPFATFAGLSMMGGPRMED